jgi:putative peptidoglycan lipid II flippase
MNLALNLALMHPLQQVGIALSTSIAAWFNAITLAVLLRRRDDFAPDWQLASRVLRTILASAAMAIVLELMRQTPLMRLPHAIGLASLIVAGLAAFAIFGLVLGAFRPAELRSMLRRTPPLDPAAQAG